MKKETLKLLIITIIGGTLILPIFCPIHQTFDTCWMEAGPNGTQHGDE